jgi:hypothetical protein
VALSNYTELQAAVRTELANVSTGGITDDSIQDAIARAEAKINRRTRLREAEQLSTATYNASDSTIESRRLAVPNDYVEILDLRWKVTSADDNTYEDCVYVAPERIHQFYRTDTNGDLHYTLRSQIEFARPTGGVDYEIMMHFIKKWDIAGDATNWLLTNYPDAYLYGACMEAAVHMRDQEGVPPTVWKALFDEALVELNRLSHRGRDDAVADISDVALLSRRGAYNILTG